MGFFLGERQAKMSVWDKVASCAYQKKYNKFFYNTKRVGKQYSLWKRHVLRRDNFRCILCESDMTIRVHHVKRWIDDPILRYKKDNGATLCFKCHGIGHKGNGRPFDPSMTHEIERKIQEKKDMKRKL